MSYYHRHSKNEYNKLQFIKKRAQQLRGNPTQAEKILWFKIKSGQFLDVKFYRQTTIGNYIVDFFAPEIKLIIELDGGQHYQNPTMQQDKQRDQLLKKSGFRILRFTNVEVFHETEGVLETIFMVVEELKTQQFSL